MTTLQARMAEFFANWMDEGRPARGLQAKIAILCEVSRPTVSAWFNNEDKVSTMERVYAERLCAAYRPDIYPAWLAEGIEPKMVTAPRSEMADHGISFSIADAQEAPANPPFPTLQPILAWMHPDDLPAGDFVMVPRLAVNLSAGNGHDQVEIEFVKATPQAFRTEWIRGMRLKPNKLAAMTASGDSMEPGIFNGDSLLVDTSQTDVVDGKVYALWYEGGERVKRLFRMPGGGLRIKSDNPNHPTIEVAGSGLEHVRILGRVVHRSGVGGLD